MAWTTPDEPTFWLAVYYGSGEKKGGEADIFPAVKMCLTMRPSVFPNEELGNYSAKSHNDVVPSPMGTDLPLGFLSSGRRLFLQ